jgi:dihydrofolate reductase
VDVVAIAAVARNGVIGKGPDIPWHIPGEQARFKRMTLGHVLVLGRRTHASIGRALPGRTTIVLSRDPDWSAPGVLVAPDIGRALAQAAEIDPDGPVWVAGGGEVYRAAWSRTTALEVTEVDLEPEGDATFPAIDPGTWTETAREPHDGFAYVRYVRRAWTQGSR